MRSIDGGRQKRKDKSIRLPLFFIPYFYLIPLFPTYRFEVIICMKMKKRE